MLSRQFTLLAITWIAAVSLVVWLVFSGRQVALENGEQATSALSAVLEQQTAHTFQALNLTLGAVSDAYQLTPRPEKNDPHFRQMMTHRLAELPFARAIFIIGPDGWILHDTDYPATPAVSLADRFYYRAHAQDSARPVTVWPPVFSRSGTGWFLPTTRALGRSEAFEGVVVAAVQAEYFREQFRNTGLNDGYRIGLFHGDGTLVAHWPSMRDEVGKQAGSFAFFASKLPASNGTFWLDSGMQSGEQVVSYRSVPDTDLVVQVSRKRSDVLAEWRRTATGAAVAMIALTGVLVWFVTRGAREHARLEYQRERRIQAEKLEALGQLTGGITHDFANFLNIITTNVALIQQRPAWPVMETALGNIDRAVRCGTMLTERLLSFARKKPLNIARVKLDSWLQDARPLLAQAAGSGTTVEVETQQAPDILCDPGQLDMALVNLVVNARDAMNGSGRITVRAFGCDDNGRGTPKRTVDMPRFVCLTVQDSGSGMSEEARKHALEPFYTTKGDGGTGLGLPQVYGFMQQLGGNITIESAAGRGTAIHLFFPVAPAESADRVFARCERDADSRVKRRS